MNATSEWWESFFQGPFGDWQAAGFLQQDQNTAAQAELLVATLGLKPGDSVLDVACGTGRHAIDLTARGIEVTGIDFNPAALAAARRNAAAHQVAPLFLKQDMRCLRSREAFDAAYCFWTSFGYFEDESHDLVVAKRIAEALKPGGRFLIDIVVTETLVQRFEPHRSVFIDEGETLQVVEDTRWDFESGRIESDWTFVENGRRRSRHASVRLYSYRELCDLLREAGFTRFTGYDTQTGSPFGLGSRLALVASL